MSVLIKGMDMPKNCKHCKFRKTELQEDPDWCLISEESLFELAENDCPLIEVPEWIPMTERLPNESGEYLVSGMGKVWVCEFMIFGSVVGWCNRAMNPCVEYWMPLPKPPEDGET